MAAAPTHKTLRRPRVDSGAGTGLGAPTQIVIYDDAINTMEWVVASLMEVLGHSAQLAAKIMFEAHHRGRAIAEVEPVEQATRHCRELVTRGLRADVEEL
jgi:ATP-dependent Clp protease adaptor protein ClpS